MTPIEAQKNSYAFIDYCKSICIFLIVMNHLSPAYEHINYMKSFRIPLFFFAAGFLFSPHKYKSIKELVENRLQRLVLPYFVYYILSMGIEYGFMLLRRPEQFHASQFIHHIIGCFNSIGTSEWMVAIPLWFLTCLFSVEVLYYITDRYFKYVPHRLLLIAALSVMGYGLYQLQSPRLPWNLDIALLALPFFYVGHISRSATPIWIKMSVWARLAVGTACFMINYFGSQANDLAIMSLRQYGHYGLFFINGFTGIVAMVLLTSTLPESRLIKFIGRNTLTVLGLHGWMMIFVLKLSSKLTGINVWLAISNEGVGLLVTLGIFIFLIPVIVFVNQHLPWLAGKQNKISHSNEWVDVNTRPVIIKSGKQERLGADDVLCRN